MKLSSVKCANKELTQVWLVGFHVGRELLEMIPASSLNFMQLWSASEFAIRDLLHTVEVISPKT